jgi:hypothetical protein
MEHANIEHVLPHVLRLSMNIKRKNAVQAAWHRNCAGNTWISITDITIRWDKYK